MTYRQRFPLTGLGVCGLGDEQQQKTAFGWVRQDLNWAYVEKVKGVYDFSAYLKIVQRYAAVGMRVCFTLVYGNPLYTQQPDETYAPVTLEAIDAYAKFCAAAVRALKGYGILWEIWNEPDDETFWKPVPSNVCYALLVQKAASAMRGASSTEWIAFGAISNLLNRKAFLDPILAAPTIWKNCDVISIHGYRFTEPETLLADLKNLPLPAVITEWGYSPSWAAQLPSKLSWDEQHADLTVRSIKAWRLAGIQLGFIFNWMGDEFGMRKANGAPTLALAKVQELVAA